LQNYEGRQEQKQEVKQSDNQQFYRSQNQKQLLESSMKDY